MSGMADGPRWILDAPTDPRLFPAVRHRHPNGMLEAVRDPMPLRPRAGQPASGEGRAPAERWAYACACGEVYVWERRVAADRDGRHA